MKYITDEMVDMQRECFAVKACHMMGFSVEKCAEVLHMEVGQVNLLYKMIEKDKIDFEAGF